MTITLTKPTANQWAKVFKVILWLAISALFAAGTAVLANDKNYLATLPGWNILGVFVLQIFQQEDDKANAELDQAEATIITPTVPPAV